MISKDHRILVTGGFGFIGANLVRHLLDIGGRVTVLDNLSAGCREYLDGLPVAIVEGDVLDAVLVQELVRRHDGIVHLAAQTGVPGSIDDPRHDCEQNVLGTLTLLEACRAAGHHGEASAAASAPGTPKFVLASSNAPLGRQEPPATEDKAPLPISPYGASKLGAEAYCLAYHGSWGIETVVLRFGNVYGPYSAHKGSVVARFAQDISENGAIIIDGDGLQTRDFIFVEDLCDAIVRALDSDVAGEVFQIATGIETSILDLARHIQRLMGESAGMSHGEPRRGDIRRNVSVIDKSKALLGWCPKTSLDEGLEITCQWFRQRRASATDSPGGAEPEHANG